MKPILALCLLLAAPLRAQTTLEEYRSAVADYSWRLRSAAAQRDEAYERMEQARTGFLPRLSLDGSFSANIHRFDDRRHWTFALEPHVVQVLYGGGSVRAAARQAELGYDIALCDEEFARLDVRYAADYAYWNLSAMELFHASMRQYVGIIRSLKEIVDRRFAEGYIAKGDVLMIDTRLSDAEYQAVTAEQNYAVALHNFNILRGASPDDAVVLAQGIRDTLPMPGRTRPDEALLRRPDYAAARLRIDRAEAAVRSARSGYNAQLSDGIGGSWQPYTPNRTGATYLDGTAYVQLSVPIFHWGERRRAVGAARAVQLQSEWGDTLYRTRGAGGDERLDGARRDAGADRVHRAEPAPRGREPRHQHLLLRRRSGDDPRRAAGAAELDPALHQLDPGPLRLRGGRRGLHAHHGAVTRRRENGGRGDGERQFRPSPAASLHEPVAKGFPAAPERRPDTPKKSGTNPKRFVPLVFRRLRPIRPAPRRPRC